MNDSKYKIGIIVPYFGKFNDYFDLWLMSCKHNPTIQWLLFTDDRTPYEYPTNVFVNYMEFADLVELIKKKYDFHISLETPYKLCDFKVAYGEIFEEYLSGYDYWGYCDTDIIFGDIRKFIPDDILGKYNKLFIGGHFSLYKNTKNVNSIYRFNHGLKFYYYKEVFQSSKSFAFDEYSGGKGLGAVFTIRNDFYNECPFSDILINKYAFHTTDEIYGTEDSMINAREKKYKIYKFSKGRLFETYLLNDEVVNDEKMYVHVQKRKMEQYISNKNDNHFMIIPNKFIDCEDISSNNIRKYGKGKLIYFRYYKIRIKNLLKKIRAVGDK